MSETKTYVFPESGGNGGGSGMLAMLAPLLQQKGIDPNLLVAMQGKTTMDLAVMVHGSCG